ncbi:MAG: FAD-dependent oxidoreductase [Nannocystaceae bacterium]
MTAERIAVVGAGICGLSCARALVQAGRSVSVFDKARKPGGRMSTRRGPQGGFDHGAQYFTVRDEHFGAEVDGWRGAGVAAPWTGRIGVARGGVVTVKDDDRERWVGTPTMSAIARHLSEGLGVESGVRVQQVRRQGERWSLSDAHGAAPGEFEAVVIAVPAEQAVPLLSAAPTLAAPAAPVQMDPCWAVMVSLAQPLRVDAEGLFVHDSPLAWVAHDGSKPGRSGADTWVLHATPQWTHEHWEDDPQAVTEALLHALAEATGQAVPAVVCADHQRWRYARADAPLPERCLFDPQLRLGAGGDWCGGPRVEGAWLSGLALARALLESGTRA